MNAKICIIVEIIVIIPIIGLDLNIAIIVNGKIKAPKIDKLKM